MPASRNRVTIGWVMLVPTRYGARASAATATVAHAVVTVAAGLHRLTDTGAVPPGTGGAAAGRSRAPGPFHRHHAWTPVLAGMGACPVACPSAWAVPNRPCGRTTSTSRNS